MDHLELMTFTLAAVCTCMALLAVHAGVRRYMATPQNPYWADVVECGTGFMQMAEMLSVVQNGAYMISGLGFLLMGVYMTCVGFAGMCWDLLLILLGVFALILSLLNAVCCLVYGLCWAIRDAYKLLTRCSQRITPLEPPLRHIKREDIIW
jgi:TM2 domain-containing membrane protein YozV